MSTDRKLLRSSTCNWHHNSRNQSITFLQLAFWLSSSPLFPSPSALERQNEMAEIW